MSRVAGVASALLLCCTLTACSGATHPPADLVGKNLSEVEGLLPDDALYLVQDVSTAVDREPSYDSSQMESDRWTIVAACSNEPTIEASGTIEIAVVPSDLYPRAQALDFDDAVACEGLEP